MSGVFILAESEVNENGGWNKRRKDKLGGGPAGRY